MFVEEEKKVVDKKAAVVNEKFEIATKDLNSVLREIELRI